MPSVPSRASIRRVRPIHSPPAALTWLGHATVLVELGGQRVVTDPVLRRRVAHLVRHVPEPALDGPVDAVLLSHLHRDHLDVPSLRRIDPGARLVVPRGTGHGLRKLGRDVVELAPGEELHAGGLRITAVPAFHHVRRTPFAKLSPAVGYVLDAGPRVYFAGDTEQFDAMADLGAPAVALLPVWGWGPTLGPGHMDPEQAAAATALIAPAVAVPIHWGTYLPVGYERRHGHLLRDPPGRFAAAVARLAPATRVEILRPGEEFTLERRSVA
jgi:L-ascorbate metabolism protein UlaG (beta-lactamase superfamily)